MMFKKPRIVFTPGAMLRQLISEASYDRLDPFSDPERTEKVAATDRKSNNSPTAMTKKDFITKYLP